MQKFIAVDLETNSTNKISGKIVGISICYDLSKAYYIPLRHNYGKQLKYKYVLSGLKPILEDKNKFFIGHNIKFDLMIFQNEGVELSNLCFDTMLASYLLAPEEHRHNLNAVSLKYLRHKMIPINKLIGKGKKQINFAETDIKDASDYSAEDANITFRLWKKLEQQLKKEDLLDLFNSLELPLIKTLANMERNGVFVDVELFRELSEELGKNWKNFGKKFMKFLRKNLI